MSLSPRENLLEEPALIARLCPEIVLACACSMDTVHTDVCLDVNLSSACVRTDRKGHVHTDR